MRPRVRGGRAGAARGRRPDELRERDRGVDVALPAAALGGDPGALGGPAPLRLVLAGGAAAGGGGDGRHPGVPGVGGELLRPVRDLAGRPPPGARVPQHLVLDARRRRAAARSSASATGADPHDADHHGASSPDGEFFVKGFECLGACDIAPMVSIDRATTGRSTTATRSRRSRRCAPGPSPCRRRRSRAVPPPAARSRRPTSAWREPTLPETAVLFRHIDDPELRTIEGYRRRGGYTRARARLQGARPGRADRQLRGVRACAAAAAPGSRWARRAPSCPAAR